MLGASSITSDIDAMLPFLFDGQPTTDAGSTPVVNIAEAISRCD
jgi:hypothetical protein